MLFSSNLKVAFEMRCSIGSWLLLFSLGISLSNAANILGIFTSTGQSHLIIHMAIARALAERGHNVTVVTTLPLKDSNPNYHHVFVPPTEKDFAEWRMQISDAASGMGNWHMMKKLIQANVNRVRMQDKALKHPRFKELLSNSGNQFDLVILGVVFNTFQLGVAAHFKCPVILSWVNNPGWHLLAYTGSPLSIASVPLMTDVDLRSFKQRVINFLITAWISAIEEFSDYKMEQYYVEHFPADRYPSYDEMKKNISLVFCASHYSEGKIRPLTPSFVEIGGVQVKEKPNQLPRDVEEFLEAADDGFILFSLGTNVKTSDISPNTTSAMFKVLSQTKQKVLWKWDSVVRPGNSPNILFKSWFPQDDLLAHPKLRLFITHAGKGSSVEAQFHGVPMLAVPVYGDQPVIAKDIVKSGFGLLVHHKNLTEESFGKSLFEVLNNPTYLQAIKKFSKLYRDRPLSPKDSVVYWSEYVIRHHGAKHMQSPVIHMNIFQANSLDVIGFLVLVVYLSFIVLRGSCRVLRVLIFKKKVKFD